MFCSENNTSYAVLACSHDSHGCNMECAAPVDARRTTQPAIASKDWQGEMKTVVPIERERQSVSATQQTDDKRTVEAGGDIQSATKDEMDEMKTLIGLSRAPLLSLDQWRGWKWAAHGLLVQDARSLELAAFATDSVGLFVAARHVARAPHDTLPDEKALMCAAERGAERVALMLARTLLTRPHGRKAVDEAAVRSAECGAMLLARKLAELPTAVQSDYRSDIWRRLLAAAYRRGDIKSFADKGSQIDALMALPAAYAHGGADVIGAARARCGDAQLKLLTQSQTKTVDVATERVMAECIYAAARGDGHSLLAWQLLDREMDPRLLHAILGAARGGHRSRAEGMLLVYSVRLSSETYLAVRAAIDGEGKRTDEQKAKFDSLINNLEAFKEADANETLATELDATYSRSAVQPLPLSRLPSPSPALLAWATQLAHAEILDDHYSTESRHSGVSCRDFLSDAACEARQRCDKFRCYVKQKRAWNKLLVDAASVADATHLIGYAAARGANAWDLALQAASANGIVAHVKIALLRGATDDRRAAELAARYGHLPVLEILGEFIENSQFWKELSARALASDVANYCRTKAGIFSYSFAVNPEACQPTGLLPCSFHKGATSSEVTMGYNDVDGGASLGSAARMDGCGQKHSAIMGACATMQVKLADENNAKAKGRAARDPTNAFESKGHAALDPTDAVEYTKCQMTALLSAATEGNVACVKAALGKLEGTLHRPSTCAMQIPLNVALRTACELGHVELFWALLQWGASPHSEALSAAARGGHKELVQSLVTLGVPPITSETAVL